VTISRTLLMAALALLTFTAWSTPAAAQEAVEVAADDDRPDGMDDLTWAELQHSATLDTGDLYEDEAVTSEEFAAQLAALDQEMAATIEANAEIVYPGEE